MKPRKDEIVPGLLLRSTRYPEVVVVDWFNKSRGIVRCQVLGGPRHLDLVTLPMQVLRWA